MIGGVSLSASAARVQRALLDAGIAADVQELPDTTRTADEAARAIGCSVEQIAKTVVFRRDDSSVPVLVVLRGVDRVDTRALAAHAGSPVKRADPDFVKSATGFAIGGVPPIGHTSAVQVVLDSALLAYDVVWAAAGTPHAVFAIDPRKLAAIAGTVADIREAK